MKLSFLFLAVLLTGCVSSVDGWKVHKAIEFCSDKGGVDHIGFFVEEAVVRCQNGNKKSVWELIK